MGAATVIVAHKSGSPASGVRVTGAVPMGGVTKDHRTGSDGRVVLQWAHNSNLSDIYINGKGHKGPFKNGGTYTFQL